MSLLSRVFNKPAQVSFVREGQTFFLHFLYGNHSATYAEVVDKWHEIGALDRFVSEATQSSIVVSLADVDALRTLLMGMREQYAAQKKLNFYISSDVEAAEVSTMAPNDYVVRYVRQGNSLRRVLPYGTVELEEGWMSLGNHYWRFEKLNDVQLAGFQRDVIEPSSLVSFLKEDMQGYLDAGIPILSDISYSNVPADQIRITSFDSTSIELQPIWHVDYKDIDESFLLADYLLANNVVYPGIRPSDLQTVIRDLNQSTKLEGCEAASFLDKQYNLWKRHMIGDLTAFEAVHRWIEPPYRWVLIARAKEILGIGRTYAYPYASIGGEEFSVDQLQDMLKQQYVRVSTGWVRQQDLCTLGMDENACMGDGTSLKPLRLDADLLLHRGGKKIDTIFSEMRLDGLPWRDHGDKHSCARDHLGFLVHWGINGGVIGGYEAMVTYGMPFILRYSMVHREAMVLVLGSKKDCEALSEVSSFYGNTLSDGQAQLMPYADFVGKNSMKMNTKNWDLVCLIEPDIELSKASSAMVQAIATLKSACKIGFFLDAPFENAEWMSLAMTILGYRGKQELVGLLVRDSRNPKPLFDSYRFVNKSTEQKELSARPNDRRFTAQANTEASLYDGDGAVILLNGMKGRAIPVPNRHTVLNAHEGVISSNWREPKKDFFEEARNHANDDGIVTTHVPFTCYWPKYSDMSEEQRKWYFYLRSQLRKGTFPDTDLSYLFVYIYELINQIGVESPEQGLDMLMEIWNRYWNLYPQLSGYLSSWVFDYIRVNNLEYPMDKLLMSVPELSDHGLNVALTELAERKASLMLPIWTLEKLSQYRVTSSKFYQKGYSTLVDSKLPDVVAAVDKMLREKSGKGVLETYADLKLRTESINAFTGALTESPRIYQVKCRNYTSGLKLQNFLKNLVRYIENSLRAHCKYSTRLQGVDLSEPIKAYVDDYLNATLVNPKTTVTEKEVPKIELDFTSVDRLRVESNQVREAIIASVGEELSSEGTRTEVLVKRPIDAPEGLLTDLELVQRILMRLSGEQRMVLDMMRNTNWTTNTRGIQERLPQAMPEVLVDEINEAALSQLGCALIEREGNGLVVAEDYRDELEYLMPKQSSDSLWSINAEGLDDDWKTFFQQVHERFSLDALAALLDGPETLAAYAKTRDNMPDLLLDGINEIASDTIGDLVADSNGIFDDYLPIIQNHLIKE